MCCQVFTFKMIWLAWKQVAFFFGNVCKLITHTVLTILNTEEKQHWRHLLYSALSYKTERMQECKSKKYWSVNTRLQSEWQSISVRCRNIRTLFWAVKKGWKTFSGTVCNSAEFSPVSNSCCIPVGTTGLAGINTSMCMLLWKIRL